MLSKMTAYHTVCLCARVDSNSLPELTKHWTWSDRSGRLKEALNLIQLNCHKLFHVP